MVWAITPGNPNRVNGHETATGPAAVTSVAFSPDGRSIVSASLDGDVRLQDMESGQERLIIRREPTVRSAAFSPDGRRIVTASDDKTARLWDTATGALIRPSSSAWPSK